MKRTAKSLLAMLVVLTLLVAAVPFAMMSTAAVTDAQGNVWTYGQYNTWRISKVEPADGVTELTLPTELDGRTIDGVWGGFASSDLNDVTSIIIPDGYKTLEGSSFKNFTTLEKIQIADSVSSIGTSAFEGCTSLTSLRFPDSFTNGQIQSMLKNCTSLISVDLNNLTSLHATNLVGCTALKYVYVNSNGCKISGASDNYIGDPDQGLTIVLGDNVNKLEVHQYSYVNICEIVWPENSTVVIDNVYLPFRYCNFVSGVINLDNVIFKGNQLVSDGCQYTTVDGTFNIYVGDKASTERSANQMFYLTANGTAATTVNLYFEGSNDGTWEYGKSKEFNLQGFTGTANIVENKPYSYKYGDENVDETKLGDTPTLDGYVFAGYNGEDPIWVDDAVLSVKAQLLEGTDINSETTSIRFLSTTDALTYKNVGFKIEVEGCAPYRFKSKNVYTAVKALGLDVSAADLSECDDSEYIFGVNLSNIQYYDFETPITVTPFWTAPNGMIAEGVSRTVTVADLLA